VADRFFDGIGRGPLPPAGGVADLAWNAPFYARHGFTPVAEAELTSELRGLRARERELGLDALGPRTTMIKPLSSPDV
jgi:hypothetical protein